jgi:thiol peroxidase
MADISFKGTPLHTIGRVPAVGTQAPEFTLTRNDLGEWGLKDHLGKVIVLNIFPSLDTDVCAKVMLQFNEIAGKYYNVVFLCISADLPFAQKRFCSTEHLANVLTLSIFRHTEFGDIYGVTILEGALAGLLARAVIIIDAHGKIAYTQQVSEITEEPNYIAAQQQLDKLSR